MKKMAFELELAMPYEQAVDVVIDELKQEGFGVLTRIDVHDALKEKLDVEFRPYSILGACNPPLAHKALSNRPDVGLMLPCNVVVESVGENRSLVRILLLANQNAAAAYRGVFHGDLDLRLARQGLCPLSGRQRPWS